MRKSRIVLMLAAGLAFGCARPDWIQQTLVTVDVTGTWQTTEGALFVLALEQQGLKVKGLLKTSGLASTSGPIDGDVAGDVFSFKLTNGNMSGQLTVTGDEMSGTVRGRLGAASPGSVGMPLQITLRRVDSSVPAPSQQR